MNLYEVKADKKMYFVMPQGQVDGRANVDIFSINTPLIPVSELIQEGAATKSESKDRSNAWWMFLLIGLLGVATIVSLAFNFKKRNEKQTAAEPLPEKTLPEVEASHYDFSKSSVRFFGGFTVMDKNGNDISSKFSHTTKALFILLILYSDGGKGIAGSKLNHILWSYKPEDQTNNNRNVYMIKLRPLLEGIGDVMILNQNKLWSIHFGEGSICDYIEVKNLLRENSSDKIDWILELLLKVVMLPNIEYGWRDDFKSGLSNSVIDFLCGQLDRPDLSNKTLLEITDIIFKYDFLNRYVWEMLFAGGDGEMVPGFCPGVGECEGAVAADRPR